MRRKALPLLLAATLALGGCFAFQQVAPQESKARSTGSIEGPSNMEGEKSMCNETTENVIYLAGGCFWGMEQLMQSIPGVIDAQSGYANGTCEADANYPTVYKGNTGFRETVRVEYDPDQVSLDALLLAYFYVIDPTVENRQGNDRGSQYQTGVYYTNDKAKETVERIAEIERSHNEKFFVEIGPLKNYYPAEIITRITWRRTPAATATSRKRLGHVFTNDPESPNGVRYCINSASLRFVPYAKMEAEGYGYLLDLFKE